MNCSEFRALLDNYANLSEDDLKKLNSHADECAVCRAELEFFNSIMSTAASVSFPEPPQDFLDKVNKRIDSIPHGFGRITYNIRVNSKRYAALAACLIVGVTVGVNYDTIRKHLSDDKADGVISTTVSVTDNDSDNAEPSLDRNDDAVPAVPQTEAAAPQTHDTASSVVPTPVPARKPSAHTVPQADKPVPAVKTPVQPTAEPVAAATGVPEVIKETEAPAANPVQAEPEPTPQSAESGTYVMPRSEYSLPKETETAEPVVPSSSETSVYGISDDGRGAVVAYNVSDDERDEDPTGGNRLIVSMDNVDLVVQFMAELGFTSSNGGYEAPKASLNLLLSKLDSNGIYYEYIQRAVMEDRVYFKIGVTD